MLSIAVVLLELLAADMTLEFWIWFEICMLNFHMMFQALFPLELFLTVFTFVVFAINAKFLRVHGPHVTILLSYGVGFKVTELTMD